MSISRASVRNFKPGSVATGRRLSPVHPGEVLREDFMRPLGLTAYRMAQAMGVSQTRLGEILKGSRAVTAETALRLERVFGMEAQVWLNLQAQHDLEVAARDLGERLEAEVTRIDMAGRDIRPRMR